MDGTPDQALQIDLALVHAFVVVAEEEHLSRAAERLFVAQPTLTGQMKRLEAALGAELLDRSGPSIALTPQGSTFLTEARTLLAVAAVATQRVRQANS